MKDIKFNYYLETKENVINMLESYFVAVTKQYEELEEAKKPYIEKIEKYKKIIDEKLSKRQDIRWFIDDKRKQLLDERTSKEKKIMEKASKTSNKIQAVMLIALIVLIAFIILDSGLIDGIIVCVVLGIIISPIVMYIMKFFDPEKSRSVKAKIEKINNEYNSRIKDIQSFPDEYYETAREIEQLDKELRVLQTEFDNIEDSKIDLRKKFNIPTEIVNYEHIVYEWLVKNRVSSFNEALDKLDEYKHREEIESMQRDQYTATQNLEAQVQRQLKNINERFDANRALVNEVKDLASNALSAAKNAESAAEYAAYAAKNN